MINRKSVLQDIKHGGIYNDTLNNTSLTFVCGTCNNHCQKIESDPNLTFTKGAGTSNEDTLNLTGTSNVTVDANIGCNANIGNDACICNDAFVERCACIGCDAAICNDLYVECNTCIGNDLAVCNNAVINCDALVCHDAEVCNDLVVDCNSCLKGTLDVDGVSNFNCTVYVNGDLHVKGTSYDEHTVDLLVGADHITLRECATQGLGTQERAGLIIDHYDATGNKSLGIVGDYTGTARVGEIEIVHVWTTDDTTFYSDREMTTPTTIPSGKQLFQIGDTDPTTGEKEYYYVANDDTEPIATRSEDMCDHQLTCWNATNCDIETIGSLPSNNGAILQYDTTNCCYCHLENPGADGRLLTYDCTGDKLKWNENGPTGNEQILKWNACTKAFEYLPLGNEGEQLTVSTVTEYHKRILGLIGTSSTTLFDEKGNTATQFPSGCSFEGCVSTPNGNCYYYDQPNNIIYEFVWGTSDRHKWTGGYIEDLSCVSNTACLQAWGWHFQTVTSIPTTTVPRLTCWYENGTCSEIPKAVWKCGPSSYVFNTMAEYTAVAATIPANSQVTILCENNYTTSEQV